MSSRLLALCAAMSFSFVAAAACDASTIRAVGNPSGVYKPDQGCTLVPGAPACPGLNDPQPQFTFELEANPGFEPDTSRNSLSNVKVTCLRSYCGSGSLTAHADLRWTPDADYPQRMATLSYFFDPPVEMMGRTLSYAVRVENVTAPMHSQVGVVFDYWRWVGWSPVSDGWNHIEGVVSPANPLTGIDPSVTAIPVTELRIDLYVPVADASGPNGTWSGDIYLDDVGWR